MMRDAARFPPAIYRVMFGRRVIAETLTPPFDLPMPLEYRRSPRARRVSLRLDLAGGKIVLTAPLSLAQRHAVEFLVRHEGWLRARLAQAPAHRPFAPGVIVPILGIDHVIEGDSSTLRGRVTRGDNIVIVPGAAEHLPRRLTEFLKAEARREIAPRARAKAQSRGLTVAAVALRDTRSRWGSCTRAGRISYCWRLILAPEFVLDYVVAHEVAHLAEMNYGPRFWRLCAELTQSDPAEARAWLRRHGPELHRYG